MRNVTYSDYVIFVDESGDHSLEVIDGDYPVFVLDFCIFRKDHYLKVLPKIHAFKFEYFGHDSVVLHEHDIRKQKPPFLFLKDKTKRAAFMKGLTDLVEKANFTVVATVINKHKLAGTYANPTNPYELALQYCMERAYYYLREKGQHKRTTHIVVERRGRREDDELELAFRRIRDSSYIQGKMPNFEIIFADKKINSAGLQLADLTVRPIGRYVLDPKQLNRAWEIIQNKLYRNPEGDFNGWGLKVFP